MNKVLERGEILKLSNNKEYIVTSSIIYRGTNYVYLIDSSNNKDYKILRYVEEVLKPVHDEKLLKELIIKFNDDLKKGLTAILKESE